MQKVRLMEGEISENWIPSISVFVQAANSQGFDVGWVETVLMEAIANRCVNFRAMLLEHVEIIPRPSNCIRSWTTTN